MLVHLENQTIDKLVELAGGDVALVSEAAHVCSRPHLVGWWFKRIEMSADLGDVVKYIVRKTREQ